jgi:hypothetical protein
MATMLPPRESVDSGVLFSPNPTNFPTFLSGQLAFPQKRRSKSLEVPFTLPKLAATIEKAIPNKSPSLDGPCPTSSITLLSPWLVCLSLPPLMPCSRLAFSPSSIAVTLSSWLLVVVFVLHNARDGFQLFHCLPACPATGPLNPGHPLGWQPGPGFPPPPFLCLACWGVGYTIAVADFADLAPVHPGRPRTTTARAGLWPD